MAERNGWESQNGVKFRRYNRTIVDMKKSKSLIRGILCAIGLAFAVYFIFYGIRATGILSGIPFLHSFIMNMSNHQIVLFSGFVGLLYFSFEFLSKTLVSLFAAAFLFMLVFWCRETIPGFWTMIETTWNNLLRLFSA